MAFLCVACGDGGGSGAGGSGGSGAVSNDPGREVTGCFECEATEYCLIVSGATDVYHCATSDCELDCECFIADGQSRLEVCQTLYSCQEGGDILYCYED